jgi:hypothetical protein
MTPELLEALKQADPVDPAEIRTRPRPAETLAAIIAAEPDANSRGSRLRPTRLIPALVAALALVAVVAALLPGSAGKASPEAAEALSQVAGVAGAQTSTGPTSGFTYSRQIQADRLTTGTGDSPAFSVLVPTRIETWVAPDGSGRVRGVRQGVEWPGPRDERRWRAAGSPPLGAERSSDERFGPGELNDTGAEGNLPPTRELPADPERLAEIFKAEAAISSASVPVDVKSFEYATSVLLQAGSSPELRAALYELVAGIEGVELTGEQRDPIGRTGTAVSIDTDYSGAPTRYTLIFDPDTSQPLANTERLLEPQDWIDGDLLGYAVLERTSHVSSLRDRPKH